MYIIKDTLTLRRLNAEQRGVYAKSDLQTAFGAAHPTGLARRIRALSDHGLLRRFCRGWYVAEEFDLATLSQRLAPESYVSFGTILARDLIIGTNSDRFILAVKTGRPRRYACDGYVIEHVSANRESMFGYSIRDGVRYADTEKAVVDVLYFHLRGRRYPFDIHSDLALEKLDQERLRKYVERYHNPRFVSFAKKLLEIP